ncbi:MAG: creatininase family protein [Polaromonas sp.]|nr:creatininase family protein [Polaromonas sp.]
MAALATALMLPLAAQSAPSVFIEDLTTTEVSAALRDGKTTLIIPVGGTEQSGPHIALGKHNARVKVLAERIATQLGNALVAPTVAYVPEGNVTPPTEHMRYSGTISIPDAAFKGLLTGAAQSFRQHGFTNIVLIGDHGGYQSQLQAVATSLNKSWAGTPARAHFVGVFYTAAQTTYVEALKARGLTTAQIGIHAGVADTALLMATVPGMAKTDQFAEAFKTGKAGGTNGDPRASTAELGQLGVDAIVTQTTAAIRRVIQSPP